MKKNIITSILFFVLVTAGFFFAPKQARAQQCPANYMCSGGCTSVGQCVGGFTCEANRDGEMWSLNPGATRCGGGEGTAILGGIYRPAGVRYYSSSNGSYTDIGIINFISRMLRILTIICGVWFMINMIYAGILFITSSGDTAVFGKFKDSLLYSIIGLAVLATAYLVAGLIGVIFFGDAGFIIRPTLIPAG